MKNDDDDDDDDDDDGKVSNYEYEHTFGQYKNSNKLRVSRSLGPEACPVSMHLRSSTLKVFHQEQNAICA